MNGFLEHPSRVSRWRDGGFQVHPDAARAELTCWFGLEPDAGGRPRWEGLLAVVTGPSSVRLAGVPVFAYDVNLGDEISVERSADGSAVATGLLRDAGQVTLRVVLPPWQEVVAAGGLGDPADGADERWQVLQVELSAWDCWFDVYSPRTVAVSADPAVAQQVGEVLGRGERAGRWAYETGRTL